MLRGVDISNNNGACDLTAIRRGGASFVFIKAEQGTEYHDSYFRYNWAQAERNGLVRGAYHFLEPWEDGRLQAEALHAFVRQNGHFKPGDFVALDIEWINGPDGSEHLDRVVSEAESFIRYARPQIDKQIVIYTSSAFWADVGNPHDTLLGKFPLWAASWGSEPKPFGAWPNVSFWQSSGNGRWPGVSGDCDINFYLGDRASLNKLRHNPPKI